ncbi:60S ribosomal protein L29-like [Mastomys coucha]|uniref:60S ribosomal protein L29-like n=1 Tax=Mastomys coucha TaxID=35658 RepID=UPI0012615743|nr:60S ribosomal protein L29-like [Mastomys coucha]
MQEGSGHRTQPMRQHPMNRWDVRVTVQTWPSPRTTPHTTSPAKGKEMASRSPSRKDSNLLRGLTTEFPRTWRFAKKYKKSPKKMRAKNLKAVSACAEAIKALVKPQAIKPKMPKGPSLPKTQPAAPSERRSALIGSFERLRAIGLADPGIFTAASLKLLALGL